MSILKLNNKIVTLGGSVIKVPLAKKDDLINMDLDGNGNKTYRILKMDNNIAEVMAMYDTSTVVPPFDSKLSNIYATFSNAAKAAIISKTMYQYQYNYNSSVYNAETHASYIDYNTKVQVKSIGKQFIYGIDLENIESYFNSVFSSEDLWLLFWNTTSRPTGSKDIWLPSATNYSDNPEEAMYIWIDYLGWITHSVVRSRVNGQPKYNYRPIRPAFQIDLSKIPFTKTTEVIS